MVLAGLTVHVQRARVSSMPPARVRDALHHRPAVHGRLVLSVLDRSRGRRSESSNEVVGLDRLAAGAPLTSQVALAIRPHDTERESRLLHVGTPAVLHAEKVSDLVHERRCNHCWTAV